MAIQSALPSTVHHQPAAFLRRHGLGRRRTSEGLYDPEILEGRSEKYVDTPFGKPSDALILGKIKNVDCVLLARHGRQHTIMLSKVNYRANIWALKEEGCTHIIVTTACGSLREEIQPGDIIIIDQFIGRTTSRPRTFYDGSHSCAKGMCHIPVAEPFCPKTREVLTETSKKLGLRCHSKGTVITIKGPRFSSGQKASCSVPGEHMLSIQPQFQRWFLLRRLEFAMQALPWQPIMTAGRSRRKQFQLIGF
ncbi:S-methyl-5'-thioadenosine phosphorylase [Heterocephalus glaber]|uniref:S-methyl-5'-thioadenosine phosphorylase n=1 Tax=Heterocephalus glaber TaxID=10181 RepID=G5BU32_HETGA|nr:S-methyl-5'-thioadenosine phosphorylase [Heterocephalus glaber]